MPKPYLRGSIIQDASPNPSLIPGTATSLSRPDPLCGSGAGWAHLPPIQAMIVAHTDRPRRSGVAPCTLKLEQVALPRGEVGHVSPEAMVGSSASTPCSSSAARLS